MSCEWRKSTVVALLGATLLLLRAGPARGQQGLSLQPSPNVMVPPPPSGSQTMELRRRPPRLTLDATLSGKTTDYLHDHRLPYVKAEVSRDASGKPASVKLSGKVRTLRGKEDAERRTDDFLVARLPVDNQILVDPNLSLTREPFASRAIPEQFAQPANPVHLGFVPEAFKGCWKGTNELDSVDNLSWMKTGGMITSTYTICIKQSGDASWHLTSLEGENDYSQVPSGCRISDDHDDLRIVSSEGQSICFHDSESFKERCYLLFAKVYSSESDTTLTIQPSGNLIARAQNLESVDGRPTWLVIYHAELSRIAE